MRFLIQNSSPQDNEYGRMSVSQFEQLDRFEDHDELHDRALLQTAITEAFAFLNAGARQEAIDRIFKQYQDSAARSDAGCYIFGLIYFNADDLRHARRAGSMACCSRGPRFGKRFFSCLIVFNGWVSLSRIPHLELFLI